MLTLPSKSLQVIVVLSLLHPGPANCQLLHPQVFGPLIRAPSNSGTASRIGGAGIEGQAVESGIRAACGDSSTCLASCFLNDNCGGSAGGASAGIEGQVVTPPSTMPQPAAGPGFMSGDGSEYFAEAGRSQIRPVATTCYATVQGKTVQFNATIDMLGRVHCEVPASALMPGQGVSEGAGSSNVEGALLPERALNPALGDAAFALLDNPGRLPGQYADALEELMAANNPGLTLQMRQLAAEAKVKFLDGGAAPLPRSLDRAPRLLRAPGVAPDFYSSTLGGAKLMLQLFRLYQTDPIASSAYLQDVIRFASTMMLYGTDRYGTVHSPLFASVLNIQAQPVLPQYVLLEQYPPQNGIFRPINFPNVYPAGNMSGPQYQAYWGANVAADQDLYELLYQLTSWTRNGSYATAADAALNYFSSSCLVPASNLFAWGLHAQWDFWNDTWAQGVTEYNGTACCPHAYQLHVPVPVPDSLIDKLWSLNATAMQLYTRGLVQASVVNIGAPAFFAYDTRGGLWASPRAAAAAQQPSGLDLQNMTQSSAAGGLMLRWGALGLIHATDPTYLSMMEHVWVAVVTGIRGQKSRFHTDYYPDGNFALNGTLGPAGIWRPSTPIQGFAAKAATLLPLSGPGSSLRIALLSLVKGEGIHGY